MSEQNQIQEGENVVKQEVGSTANKNKKMFLVGLLILLGLAVVVAIGVSIYRAYKLTAEDKFTVTVAKILRLPAGKVNGKLITYADYTDDLRAIHIARESAKEANKAGTGQYNQVADYTDAQLSDQVYWRLVTNVLAVKASDELNVKVTQTEVDEQKNKVVEFYKTVQGADTGLQKEYGWNLAQFVEKVVRPYLMQNKLAQAISEDKTRQSATVERAQKVLAEIKGGLSFDDAVKKYSEDTSGAVNGEWGEATKEQLTQFSPELVAAVEKLKDGEMAADLLSLPDGLHIVKLEGRKNQENKDAAGKKTTVQLLHLRHVVFAFPTFSDYLDDMICKSDVKVYLNVSDPFKTVKEKCAAKAAEKK